MPALLTRMSTRPQRSTVSATIFRTASKSVTEAPLATASPPMARISSTTRCAAEAEPPRPLTSLPRSLTTTLAPRRARSSACWRPRPAPAPVTMATLLFRLMLMVPVEVRSARRYPSRGRPVLSLKEGRVGRGRRPNRPLRAPATLSCGSGAVPVGSHRRMLRRVLDELAFDGALQVDTDVVRDLNQVQKDVRDLVGHPVLDDDVAS